jgi:hypothetical protein
MLCRGKRVTMICSTYEYDAQMLKNLFPSLCLSVSFVSIVHDTARHTMRARVRVHSMKRDV